MSSTIGNRLKVTVFGQSHSPAIGGVVDNFPAGVPVDLERVYAFTARRAPGGGPLSTARTERDRPNFVSGIKDGVTCDAPIAFFIENGDARSSDYGELRRCPRPSHADYPALVHSGGFNDVAGGGHFSGRLTAPLCAAGALCLQFLASRGIAVGAHILSVGGVCDDGFDMAAVDADTLAGLEEKPFPVLDDKKGELMREAILSAKADGDSVGGVVECAVTGLEAGLGSPMFDTVEGRLAHALFGIPALKGVEFGSGFAGAGRRGSVNNDPYAVRDGRVVTLKNDAGGVLGGLTTGMPVVVRAAFKPTPSVALPQRTVDLERMCERELVIKGRHDPCIVPRAVPVVEAVCAVVISDIILGG